MDSPDCYTILRIFKWIRANLQEHTGYDYLDINDNSIIFIFQKKINTNIMLNYMPIKTPMMKDVKRLHL